MIRTRWLVLLGALLVQPCLGAIYAWGVFVPSLKASRGELTVTLSAKLLGLDPGQHDALAKEYSALKTAVAKAMGTEQEAAKDALAAFIKGVPERLPVDEAIWSRYEYGCSGTQSQLIFGTGILVFSLMMILGGRWQDRVGPRRVAISGGLIVAAGYALAAVAGPSFSVVWLAIGVIGGAGIGLAYVCPVAASMKWFPDMRGLITGLAVAGFGGGGFLFVKLAGNWGGLIAHEGVAGTWLTFAAIFAVLITLGASLLRNPPAGWKPPGWSAAAAGAEAGVAREWTPLEAAATTAFWLLWLAFILAPGCGMMVITSLKDFAVQEGGLSGAEADGALALLALFNAAGRITWGWVSQWLSARRTLVLISLLQALMLAILSQMGSEVWTLELAGCWVGFHFGGNMSLFPLLTAEYFGTKNLGANYGLLFTGYGLGGLLLPLVAGQVWDRTHSYEWAFLPAAVACLVAMGLAMMVRTPVAESYALSLKS